MSLLYQLKEAKIELMSLRESIDRLIYKTKIHMIISDFKLYCRYMVSTGIRWNWFHDHVSDELMHGIERKNYNLIYQTHNQTGKTLQCGLLFASWFLLRFPNKSVLYGTYNSDRAEDITRSIRSIMISEKFKHISKYFRLKIGHEFANSSDKKSTVAINLYFNNACHRNSRGSFKACGVNTAATGAPAHLILVDDYFKNEQEALSVVKRNTVWSWWQTVCDTRQQSTDEGCVKVVFCTRMHSDDIIGRILREDEKIISSGRAKKYLPWKMIIFPAEKEIKHLQNEYDIRRLGERLLTDFDIDNKLVYLDELMPNLYEYELHRPFAVLSNSDTPTLTIDGYKLDFYKVSYYIGDVKGRFFEKLALNTNFKLENLEFVKIDKENNHIFIDYVSVVIILNAKGGRSQYYETFEIGRPEIFRAMLQQEPLDHFTQIFKKSMFEFYNQDNLPSGFSKILISVDPNTKKTDHGSESGITVWGQNNRCLYLLDIAHGRWSFAQNLQKIKELFDKFNHHSTSIIIEDAASGNALFETLRNEGYAISTTSPRSSKHARATTALREINVEKDIVNRVYNAIFVIDNAKNEAIKFQNSAVGFTIFLPNEHTHAEAEYFLSQLLHFTGLEKDGLNDLVDSFTQAIAWFKENDYSNMSVKAIQAPQKSINLQNGNVYNLNLNYSNPWINKLCQNKIIKIK